MKRIRYSILAVIITMLMVVLGGCGSGSQSNQSGDNALYVGIAGPFSGDSAEYGAMWKKGLEIAAEEINAKGGIKGRQVKLIYEDSQADPKQSASIAQKFAKDERIIAELGDFSTNATWSASPIYQKAGLVQLAFNPSHPELTKPGDYVFQLCPTQADQAIALANLATDKLKAKKVAVLYLNTDFGKAVKDNVVKAATAKNTEVVATEAYLPTDKDFKAQLTKVKELDPDVIILGSYYTDTALIMKQAKDLGVRSTFIASSSVHSPALFSLGGDAVNGLITFSVFNIGSPGPTLQQFIAKYQEKYGAGEPDTFAVQAYDALRLIANAAEKSAEQGQITRKSVRDELAKTQNFPAASQNSITYSPTRQLNNPELFPIIAKDGKFVPYTL
jgi:branched-chain amino acid transport system substrate-binding protein